MKPIVLEGLWEEIACRGEEFKGKRVRLIVLEPATEPVAQGTDYPLDAIVGMTRNEHGHLSEQHDIWLYRKR